MNRFILFLIISSLLSTVAFSQALLVAPPLGGPCTFIWDAVTTYADGTPITVPVSYTIYGIFNGNPAIKADRPTTSTSLSYPTGCWSGQYYITASTKKDGESKPSNIVEVLPLPKIIPPPTLKVTK